METMAVTFTDSFFCKVTYYFHALCFIERMKVATCQYGPALLSNELFSVSQAALYMSAFSSNNQYCEYRRDGTGSGHSFI